MCQYRTGDLEEAGDVRSVKEIVAEPVVLRGDSDFTAALENCQVLEGRRCLQEIMDVFK